MKLLASLIDINAIVNTNANQTYLLIDYLLTNAI
jgi:hypothetical protein